MDELHSEEATNIQTTRSAVKHGIDYGVARKRREEYTVSIRKLKREEFMNKRRNIAATINRMEQATKAASGVPASAEITFSVCQLKFYVKKL